MARIKPVQSRINDMIVDMPNPTIIRKIVRYSSRSPCSISSF